MEKTSKGGEKIVALLAENSKLIAASLAAEIGSCCPGIVLCSWNIKFWEHNLVCPFQKLFLRSSFAVGQSYVLQLSAQNVIFSNQ